MSRCGLEARRAVAIALLAMGVGNATAAPGTHTITIEATAFAPARLVVQRGDRVVWVNKDPFPHTATAGDRAFDSGSIAAGRSWSWQATRAGRHAYVCTLHPTMKAEVIVQ
jgi:plastocyanin